MRAVAYITWNGDELGPFVTVVARGSDPEHSLQDARDFYKSAYGAFRLVSERVERVGRRAYRAEVQARGAMKPLPVTKPEENAWLRTIYARNPKLHQRRGTLRGAMERVGPAAKGEARQQAPTVPAST